LGTVLCKVGDGSLLCKKDLPRARVKLDTFLHFVLQNGENKVLSPFYIKVKFSLNSGKAKTGLKARDLIGIVPALVKTKVWAGPGGTLASKLETLS
jgi:hypothetical protein